MAEIIDYTVAELTAKLEDSFDASVAPHYVVRNDNNKWHLAFKADGAGFQIINKIVLALKRRFDPQYCPDGDLESTARIVGTEFIAAKQSLAQIVVTNTNTGSSATLVAGKYQYISPSGEVFYFTLDLDVLFAASEANTYSALSADTGAYQVSAISGITVTRVDSSSIDSGFSFSVLDNTSYLGRAKETPYEFRKRMLADSDRQDEIAEIQAGILALPNIFECNCLFNPLTVEQTYDGITLAAKELLIIITGVATDDLAKVVALYSHHKTHMVNASDVVYYESTYYIGGKYPVYFKYHDHTDYSLQITYNYDSTRLKQAQVEASFNTALASLKTTSKHVDVVTENDIYTILLALSLTKVTVLNVDILVGGSAVSYVSIPKTRLPRLANVTYTANDQA